MAVVPRPVWPPGIFPSCLHALRGCTASSPYRYASISQNRTPDETPASLDDTPCRRSSQVTCARTLDLAVSTLTARGVDTIEFLNVLCGSPPLLWWPMSGLFSRVARPPRYDAVAAQHLGSPMFLIIQSHQTPPNPACYAVWDVAPHHISLRLCRRSFPPGPDWPPSCARPCFPKLP